MKRVHLDEPVPVYDVVGATPDHNFLVRVGDGRYCALHNCGILDEVDFVPGASIHMEQSKVMRMYRSVKRRMESRYMRKGVLPGILFLVSSKKSEHDFLEQYVKTQSDNKNILIVDEPLWNVKPASNYSGRRFKVAVGNTYIKSRVLSPTDDVKSLERQGYRIIDVPVEHREAFTHGDIDAALMDIAGISVASTSKFIAYDRLKMNYTDRINPFKSEVLTVGLDDTLDLKDFFVPDLVSESVRSQPGFIHLDLSVKGDHTGISLVTIEGTKQVKQYNRDEGEVRVEDNVDLVYRQVFTVGIQAPVNSEISLEKTRQFIYYLKSIGFNIQCVSADGYQSTDTLQQLKVAGFNTKLISLDRTPAGYLSFRAAINEERLDLLDLRDSQVESELINLEQDGVSGKVDHPIDGCFTGDTRVALSDGRTPTIEELASWNLGDVYVHTVNEETGNVETRRIERAFLTKATSDLVRVTLDSGESVTCTPDHRFMLGDGTFSEAASLAPGTVLMSYVGVGEGAHSVTSVEPVDSAPVPVYDLTIEGNHNFPLAIGVLVHNSKDEADSLCGAMYSASLSGVSTNIRYAAEDAETISDILVADSEFLEDLNNMLDLGTNVRVIDDDSSVGTVGGGSWGSTYDDMVW